MLGKKQIVACQCHTRPRGRKCQGPAFCYFLPVHGREWACKSESHSVSYCTSTLGILNNEALLIKRGRAYRVCQSRL